VNIKDINIPLVSVAGIVLVTASSVFTIETRYATAADVSESFGEIQQEMRQERLLGSISENRMWLELLEFRLEDAENEDEKEKILRQIRRLIEIQIDNDMGKIR